MQRPASLFLSHGSPMIAVSDIPASRFLARLGQELPRPSAVLAVSAHWTTRDFAVGGQADPETIHDFHGFPPILYQISYPAPGAPAVAEQAARGTGAHLVGRRGLDHGIWTVARLMWPDADMPMVPVSVVPGRSPADHVRFGQALRAAVGDDVLVMASGAATHNLRAYFGGGSETPPLPWVVDFADWLADAVEQGRQDDLVDYVRRAPHGADNHPSDEHLLPLFVALGAGGGGAGQVLHRSFDAGILAMDAFAWN